MKQHEFTKYDTSIAKFVAIILMFSHHLFAFPDRIKFPSEYISLFHIEQHDIEFLLGRFGHMCIGIFLFLSGFGIYSQFIKNEHNINYLIVDKLIKLYKSYWIIFMIFIPISFFIGYRTFHFKEFFENWFGYSSSYVGEWWFFKLYIKTLITFPIFVKIIKNSSLSAIFKIVLIAVISRTILPAIVTLDIFKSFSQTFFYSELYQLLLWLPCFLMGCVFSKFTLFSKITNMLKNHRLDNILGYSFILLFIICIKYRIEFVESVDYLLAPLLILSSIEIVKFLKLNSLFSYLGKHSTNMWLIHSLFCYQYFQKLVYFPKVPIFIVAWLVILSLGCSVIIMFLEQKCTTIYNKFLLHDNT